LRAGSCAGLEPAADRLNSRWLTGRDSDRPAIIYFVEGTIIEFASNFPHASRAGTRCSVCCGFMCIKFAYANVRFTRLVLPPFIAAGFVYKHADASQCAASA
jgi:hypothetical protein